MTTKTQTSLAVESAKIHQVFITEIELLAMRLKTVQHKPAQVFALEARIQSIPTLFKKITGIGNPNKSIIKMRNELYDAADKAIHPATQIVSRHTYKTLDGNTPFRKLSNQLAAEQRT